MSIDYLKTSKAIGMPTNEKNTNHCHQTTYESLGEQSQKTNQHDVQLGNIAMYVKCPAGVPDAFY
ncbi:hypothetical protein N9X53_00740 [Mariniblastus sp.]|nr:hypothetical protein [Mariniblastus sp.]